MSSIRCRLRHRRICSALLHPHLRMNNPEWTIDHTIDHDGLAYLNKRTISIACLTACLLFQRTLMTCHDILCYSKIEISIQFDEVSESVEIRPPLPTIQPHQAAVDCRQHSFQGLGSLSATTKVQPMPFDKMKKISSRIEAHVVFREMQTLNTTFNTRLTN